MNAIALSNQTFTIAENVINMMEGLYSLNDLHKASGNESKHQPAFFMRNQETKELIEEIERSANMLNGDIYKAVKKVQGGDAKKQGTYVCKEIVYRYAMWISPKFALIVIRAFDAMVTRTDSKQRDVLVRACEKYALGNSKRSDIYVLVGKQFGYGDGIKNIPVPLLPEAVAFVYDLMLSKQPTQTATNFSLVESNIVNQVMDYLYELRQEIRRLGGNVPSFDIDNQTIAESIITRMVHGKRLMLSFDYDSGARIKFIPQNHWVITEDNIAAIVGDPEGIKKSKLPDIMTALLGRMGFGK